jgi:hypothetical protein
MSVQQNTIAIVYDYDQTLSPVYMQEEAIFPVFGIDPTHFWKRCAELVQVQGYDHELAYMKVLLDCLEIDRPTNARLRELGARLTFYPGLPDMFEDSKTRSSRRSMRPMGFAWSITSSPRASRNSSRAAACAVCAKIFGCEFATDEHDRITFPKRAISHTQKTQFLFRINKGMLELDQDVNDHMDPALRPVPFQNMIYVGDGPTDVPCFTVMRRNGGQAIAVYNPEDPTRTSFKKCYQLSVHADRVKNIAPSDFRAGSHLRLLLEEMALEIGNRIIQRRREEFEAGTVKAPKH